MRDQFCPESNVWLKNNEYKGNFVSILSRKNVDTFLWKNLINSWNEEANAENFKYLILEPEIKEQAYEVTFEQYKSNFFKSDHAPFWSSGKYSKKIQSLPAILLWNLGNLFQIYNKIFPKSPSKSPFQNLSKQIQIKSNRLSNSKMSIKPCQLY